MLIVFAIGSVSGSFMVNKMMDSIWEYYVAINTEVIALAVSILFTIAVLTVSFRIFKVSRTNPVDSLRYE